MPYVLTLIAQREAASLSPAVLARVRDAVGGGAPDVLSPGRGGRHRARRCARHGVGARRAGWRGDRRHRHAGGGPPQVAADRRHGQHHRHRRDARRAGRFRRTEGAHRRHHRARDERRAGLQGGAARAGGDAEADCRSMRWRRPGSACGSRAGARELVATMRAHGAYTALVSGGFTFFTGRVAALCGFDMHRSNVLLDDGATLTGRVAEPILDRDSKLDDADTARGGARAAACRRRWRWATAPTIWTCCVRPVWAWRSAPSRSSRRRRGAGGPRRPARAAVRPGLPAQQEIVS